MILYSSCSGTYLWYRITRRWIYHQRVVILKLLYLWFRLIRRLTNRYRNIVQYVIAARYRLYKKIRFRTLRLLVFFMWRLWLRNAYGMENIPEREPAIIVSNHMSYYDFFVLASVLKKQSVFVAVKNLNVRTFVGWFMKLDTIVYVDRDKPGYSFLKELIRHLREGKLIVLYPEGTRTRTGKMLQPKSGFVKLAIKTGAPIVPVAMKGTYDILPPQRLVPRLKKCDVLIGQKIYVSPSTMLLRDIFFRTKVGGKFANLADESIFEIAYRIMNQVREMAGQEWDESAMELAKRFKLVGGCSGFSAKEKIL